VDFGRRHNILIVHDNPYSFVRNDSRPLSILEVEGAREVALELNSLSKGHSMAGWRVGVAVGRREWLDAILTFKSNMDTGMFYPVQAAAAEALSLGEAWFDELNAIYREREKAGSKLLDTLGCTYRPHQAGLFIWARLPDAFIGDCYDFSDMVLDRCDVFLTPGGIFGSQGLRYIRITLCYPAEVLEEAAQRIRERLHR
jgi:aspartate/tyrosine/aromatic aminotransferase